MPKPNKRPTSRPTSKLNRIALRGWNQDAHEYLARLLNEAERLAVRDGFCEPDDAHEWLTRQLLDTNRTQLHLTAGYVENDERISGEVFISILERFTRSKARASKPVGTSHQLMTFAKFYFPNFKAVLQIEFLMMLRSAEQACEIERHGLLRLAVAYIPTAWDDAEREIRRLGGSLTQMLINPELRGVIGDEREKKITVQSNGTRQLPILPRPA